MADADPHSTQPPTAPDPMATRAAEARCGGLTTAKIHRTGRLNRQAVAVRENRRS